jgi:serine/threonine protein kinase
MPSGRSGQSIAGTIVLRIPHFGGTLAIISARFSTMPLTAGARLGGYEIGALIGKGGMGEVWHARDTKLNRDVALKVLPEAFALDADRLARFKREAQVLASLNHPNIAAIYGFEDAAGAHALVLELVEGLTLADRIAQGPIPLDEALPMARQIAEALEAAHEQGVIHRDLKPANIKLRPDGAVKVLDFGLAKMLEAEEAGAAGGAGRAGEAGPAVARDFSPAILSHSPTITTPAMSQSIRRPGSHDTADLHVRRSHLDFSRFLGRHKPREPAQLRHPA